MIGSSSCIFVPELVRANSLQTVYCLILGQFFGNYSFIPFDQAERFLAALQLVFRLLQAKGLINL